MKTPPFEHEIGIDTYGSNLAGIGGKLRVCIDDFRVNEIFLYPPKKENGNFTIAEISCRNWETHTLVQEIAHRLHLSQRRISFAGTKDKRAWTTQLMSFDHVSPEQLSGLRIKDVSFENIYQSDVPVRIGGLLGNRFEITIRNIPNTVKATHITSLLSVFHTWGGFPNYYGIQRFGIIRPITHLVGKFMVHGEFEKAVLTYVAHPLNGEKDETYQLREDLEKTRDYAKAFHSYPDSLNFEKAMLHALAQSPDDFIGALNQLPKNLLMMFINAYESFLFNKILSKRIEQGLPIHQAVVGDIVFPVRKNTVMTECIPVRASNIEKVNTQIMKKKAVVTGLLVGYDTMYAKGEIGDIEQRILESEKIDHRDFIIPEIPFLSSRGSRRALLALFPSLDWAIYDDEFSKNHQTVQLRFELQKGCYATSLLREIMKSNDPKDY
ncbi:MAG: tRNA pseudouridine(13) synthase TruD [Candidatus Thermoplasmatota archaeon]|nr:tRNA pseudouridine(13) synthase TruD [Candidatus Thermoplasmatota archaeon]